MRVAANYGRMKLAQSGQVKPLKLAAQAMIARVRVPFDAPNVERSLASVIPGNVGAGLNWSPVAAAETGHPVNHFMALAQSYGLKQARDAPVEQRAKGPKILHAALQKLGAELAELHPERVRVGQPVRGTVSFAPLEHPPVSWKNGAWHHAIPLVLDGTAASQERIMRALAAAAFNTPKDDVPVFVATGTGPGVENVAELAGLTAPVHAAEHIVLAAGALDGEPAALEVLKARIIKDVTASE